MRVARVASDDDVAMTILPPKCEAEEEAWKSDDSVRLRALNGVLVPESV